MTLEDDARRVRGRPARAAGSVGGGLGSAPPVGRCAGHGHQPAGSFLPVT